MQLHQRGVDLLVNVLDAADHAEQLSEHEIRGLLNEVAEVMSQILERDAVLALKLERTYMARQLRADCANDQTYTRIDMR